MAVLIKQKFGEIPLDIIGQEALAILLLFHPRPQGMRIFAVYVALGRQIALVVVLGDKLFYAGVVERFLAAELIAWEDDEFDAFWRVLIVKLLKLSVFTISHASFGRAIDHQEGMAFVDGHGLGGGVIHHHIELVATFSRHCDSSIGSSVRQSKSDSKMG